MNIKSSWAIAVSVVVLIMAGSAFLLYNGYQEGLVSTDGNQQESQSPEQSENQTENQSGYQRDPDYPRELIEGEITEIMDNAVRKEFKVKVNLDKMFKKDIPFDREVAVSINDETEFILFDTDSGQETEITMEDFKKGESVVVATKENNDNILEEDNFTAVWVKKIRIPAPPTN